MTMHITEHCCKIGCKKEATQKQEICFIRNSGYLARLKIGWCKEHSPENILDDFTETDLLRHYGY